MNLDDYVFDKDGEIIGYVTSILYDNHFVIKADNRTSKKDIEEIKSQNRGLNHKLEKIREILEEV